MRANEKVISAIFICLHRQLELQIPGNNLNDLMLTEKRQHGIDYLGIKNFLLII